MSGATLRGIFLGALLAGLLLIAPGTSASTEPDDSTTLEVRFSGSATVRGSDTRMSASSYRTTDQVEDLLESISASGVEPLAAGLGQARATGIAREAEALSGSDGVNMADWYRIEVPSGTVTRALEMLRTSRLVVHAYRAPVALPPPVTPDFSTGQLHLDAAPTGTGAEFGSTDPRIRGAGVTVVDLEYYWRSSHEDLQLPVSTDIGGGEYIQYTAFDDEHGTAVFGILVARDNGFGVTGIVPEATIKGISPTMAPGFGYNPAGALTFLADRVSAGDVVLIEQQADGPDPGPSDYVPLEWNQASFDAIRQLSDLGVIVVETGGNGSHDLDGPDMLGRFNRNVRDSDAIVVGAGDSVTRAPLWYTSRGSRVDLQGYGYNIVTTGGSHSFLQGGADGEQDFRYTSDFGGTSGAGPIVAGAAAAVLSYLKATGQPPIGADQMAGILRSTGTAQSSPESGLIGPLPNIPEAIALIESSEPTVSIGSPAEGSNLEFNSSQVLELACGVGGGPELDSCLAVDQGPGGQTNLVTGDRLPTDQPGLHTITATATNQMGLTATDTVTYEVGDGCLAEGVALASVEPRGAKVRLLGATDPSRSGSRVMIVRSGRHVGSARVAIDGTISANAKAPASKSKRGRATYQLIVGGKSSSRLKSSNAVRVLSRRPLASADLVKGKLAGVRKKGSFTLKTHPLCGGQVSSQRVRFNRRGVFTVRLGFGTASRLFSINRKGKALPLPVVMPAARFVDGL